MLTRENFVLDPVLPPQCEECNEPATVALTVDVPWMHAEYEIGLYCDTCGQRALAGFCEGLSSYRDALDELR